MKYKWWFILLLFCFHQSANAYNRPERLLLVTHEWFPYQFQENGEIKGEAIKKIKCILKTMKQPYQLTMTSWSQAQALTEIGTQHGLFLVSENKKDNEYAVFSNRISTDDWSWFSLSDLSEVNKPKFRSSVEVTAKFGSDAWFWLQKKGYRVTKKPRTASDMLALMLNGEASVLLGNTSEINDAIKKMEITYRAISQVKAQSQPLGVYFAKNFVKRYPLFLTKFNQSIKSCQ